MTTGAADDIEKATELARMMVCDWGMSESLGPLTFGKKEEEVFLGRELATQRNYSEETARVIDKEIKRIVESAQARALSIAQENEHLLRALAEALLEKELLNGDEIDNIIAQARKEEPSGEQEEDRKGSKVTA